MKARQSDPLLEAFRREWEDLGLPVPPDPDPDPHDSMRAAAIVGVCLSAAAVIAGVAIVAWPV